MFCKKCGKKISDDSIFCSHCGTKQDTDSLVNLQSNTSFKSLRERLKPDDNKNKVIDIPQGYVFCSYCGAVKPMNEFEVSNDLEHQMCNECKKRDNRLFKIPLIILSIIFILITVLVVINEGWVGISILLFYPLVLIVNFLICFELIKKILENTTLRISLTKEREEFLSQCTDTDGNPIIHPLVYSELEEAYHRATGVYRSKDIPSGYYECPCCSNQYPISSSYLVMEGRDYTKKYRSSWIGGNRIEVYEKKYNFKICADCYKYRRIGEKFKWYGLFIGAIGLPLPFLLHFGFDPVVLVACIPGGAIIGFSLGAVINWIYKLIAGLILKKNLLVSYDTVARNAALTRRKP